MIVNSISVAISYCTPLISGARVSESVYVPSGRPVIVALVVPLVKLIDVAVLLTFCAPPDTVATLISTVESLHVSTSSAPGSSSPAPVATLLISTTEGASSIVTTALPLAVAAVTELPVIVPSVPTVNSISVATWNPSGAATSCIVYVPRGRPVIVVGVSPLTKEIVLPDLDTFVPPPVTTQFARLTPSGPVTVIDAPGSSSPATVSFLEISTTVGASSIVTTAFPLAVAAVTELPVTVPSSPIVNSISVATWNPSGAATSCIVYVPAGSPWMVVAEFPLVKLI